MSVVGFLAGGDSAQVHVPSPDKGDGALNTVRGGGLSGRPSCRIYPVGKGWGLALQRKSAWLMGMPLPSGFRFFNYLAAPVALAQVHHLDYYIVRPTPFFTARHRRRAKPAKSRARPSP